MLLDDCIFDISISANDNKITDYNQIRTAIKCYLDTNNFHYHESDKLIVCLSDEESKHIIFMPNGLRFTSNSSKITPTTYKLIQEFLNLLVDQNKEIELETISLNFLGKYEYKEIDFSEIFAGNKFDSDSNSDFIIDYVGYTLYSRAKNFLFVIEVDPVFNNINQISYKITTKEKYNGFDDFKKVTNKFYKFVNNDLENILFKKLINKYGEIK